MQRGYNESDPSVSPNESGTNTSTEFMNYFTTRIDKKYYISLSIGMSYTAGVVGGSSAHFLKAFRNSFKGQRFINGIQSVRNNAPRTASLIGLWTLGSLFVSENVVSSIRKREDPRNPIIAGAATGVLYSIRRGLIPAFKMSLGSAVALGILDGATFVFDKTVDSIYEQRSSGKTELKVMQPMFESFAEWYNVLCGVVKVGDIVTSTPN